MTASHLTDDAVLEQKIAAVVLQTLQKEADALFAEKIAAFVRENERRARELSLMERMVRVEEELKALREVQIAQFASAEKRFESLHREMSARFEALYREMTARFEAMDQRFAALQSETTARFEAMDQRFAALQREMTARFEAMDKRFEAMDKRFTMVQWTMGVGFTLIIAFMSLLKISP